MPIYEFQCRKCSAVTEKILGHADPQPRKCPSCGGRLDRKMSSGAFILKGSGWYATDYANKGNGNGRGKSAGKPAACPASAEGPSPACAGCPKAE